MAKKAKVFATWTQDEETKYFLNNFHLRHMLPNPDCKIIAKKLVSLKGYVKDLIVPSSRESTLSCAKEALAEASPPYSMWPPSHFSRRWRCQRFLSLATHCIFGRLCKTTLMDSLPLMLKITFIVQPMVTNKAFLAFNLETFDDGFSYMKEDYSVRAILGRLPH